MTRNHRRGSWVGALGRIVLIVLLLGVLVAACALTTGASIPAGVHANGLRGTPVGQPGPGAPSHDPVAQDDGLPVSRGNAWAFWNKLRGDAYELDSLDRFVETGEKGVQCTPEAMVRYSGQALKYAGGLTVSEPFRDRLLRFEEVVAEVATDVYGRAPRRIVHYGAYSCRSSRNRNYRISEHALGNAIDVVGFDFSPATKDQWSAELGLPKALRHAFQVRVAKHWDASNSPTATLHAEFLRKLTERLRDRRDVFRGLIGPADPNHRDHFHFDVAPWRYERL